MLCCYFKHCGTFQQKLHSVWALDISRQRQRWCVDFSVTVVCVCVNWTHTSTPGSPGRPDFPGAPGIPAFPLGPYTDRFIRVIWKKLEHFNFYFLYLNVKKCSPTKSPNWDPKYRGCPMLYRLRSSLRQICDFALNKGQYKDYLIN